MNAGKVFLGIVAGVSVGALLGVLFAPDRGISTCKKISGRSNAYIDDLQRQFDSFIDGISKKVDTFKDDAGRMAGNGKAKFEEAEGRITSAMK